MSIQVTVEAINKMNVTDIVKAEPIRQKFIDIYGALWGERDATAAYEREAIYFNRLLCDNDSLRKCTKTSVFIAFIDLAVCGLSLEPGVRALCYLQPRNFKAGKDQSGKDVYESRLGLTISGYGELVLRTRAGQIRHADNPVIVYEGDDFKFSDLGDCKKVEYTMNINHNANHIVACYMRITRADGTIDYAVMLPEDWDRLRGYSGKSNKSWDNNARAYVEKPNALYSSGREGDIDTGFLVAKCIKHAFKTYPKVRIGKATQMEADAPEPINNDDIYGFDPETGEVMEEQKSEPQSFAPERDNSAGVTIHQEDNDDAF